MNSEKFSRYDSADYLKTDEDIAGFLEAAIEEGGDDPAFMAHARSVIARARARNRAPGTQTDEATDDNWDLDVVNVSTISGEIYGVLWRRGMR